jgi:hypothetical protein
MQAESFDTEWASRARRRPDSQTRQRRVLAVRHARDLTADERQRLVELLCTGIERRLKQRGGVDFSADVSVDADAPKEGDR